VRVSVKVVGMGREEIGLESGRVRVFERGMTMVIGSVFEERNGKREKGKEIMKIRRKVEQGREARPRS